MILKVGKVDNALCVVFPEDSVKEFDIREGDEFDLIETENGFGLVRRDPEFLNEMEAYAHVVKKHRIALRKLSQ